MVIAIGPQKMLLGERDHAEDGGERGQHHRPRAAHGGVDDRAVAAVAGGDVVVDLVDQDHGVAHDHAGERDQAEQRDEAERPVRRSSSAPVAPIRPSGAVTNTSASREKLCSWIISSASMTIAMTGNTAASAALALALSSIEPPVSMR